MKTFKELRLRKYVLFHSVTLPLDVPGITAVYGRNKNAGAKSSNASGKSMLLSAIPQVRYDTSPLVSDIKVRAKKDAWEAGTSAELDVEDDGHRFTLVKRMDKRSFVYDILRDGKSAKTRTSEYAKTQFEKVLPWSELEYFTYVHIDSSRPNILRTGSPSDRLNFFSEVFHLDSIDTQRQLVKQELNKIRDQALIRNEIAQTKAAVVSQLEELAQTIDKSKASKLRDKIAALNKQLSKYHSTHSELKSVQSIAKAYKRVSKECGSSRDEIAAWLSTVDKEQKSLHRAIDASRSWANYHESLDSYRHSKTEWKKAMGELLPSSWFESAEDSSEEKHRLYQERSGALGELKRRVKDLENQVDETIVADPVPESADPEADLEACQRKIAKREGKLAHTRKMRQSFSKHFDGDADSECPVCASTLSREEQKAVMDALLKQEHKLASVMESLNGSINLLKKSITFRASSQAMSELEALRKKLRRETKRADASRRIMELRYPTKPESPNVDEPKSSLEEIQSSYDHLKKIKGDAELVLPIVDSCEKYLTGDQDITDLIAEVESSITETESRLEKLSDKWTDIEASLRMMQRLESDIAKLDTRLEETGSSADSDLWEILYDALGNKGLKTLLVQQLAKHLEVGMNRAAPFLLQERTKFEFIVEGVQFHILVTRRVNGKTRTTDVRNLSGAESRAFSFLLAMAMLPLLPSNRRSNLLVLDEPTANMDAPFVDQFCSQFLPKLCNVVPSVVVISPLKLDIPARRIVTVTKEGAQSTVEIQSIGA